MLLFLSTLTLTFQSCKGKSSSNLTAATDSLSDDALMDTVQRRTFLYFWEGAEPNSGLAPERYHVDGVYPQNDANVVTSGGSGFGIMAVLARYSRSSMLETIRQDYIRTARAKGAGEGRVVMHHALRNAMIPVITVIGLQIGTLLGGAVVNETVFSLPGLGTLMINAINQKNEPVVLGCLITFAIIFSLVNLLIDILYAFIDPRIKSQYK